MPTFGVNLLYTFRILDPIEPTALSRFLDVILVVIGLWILIELGCLKGTQGPNRYGLDPLGQSQADAISARPLPHIPSSAALPFGLTR